jgi:hypothetical protein
MLCDEFSDRFADLLEREVDEATRAALESHALACAECGALLADVRKLRIDASSLPELAPSRDLWQGIAQRIDAPVIPLRTGGQAKRVGEWRRWLPMAAAAVLLVALTATSTYYLTIRHTDHPTVRTAASAAARDSVSTPAPNQKVEIAPSSNLRDSAVVASRGSKAASDATASPVTPTAKFVNVKLGAEQVYADEIARLRIVLDRRRTQLDPVTISVIERNLKVIDDAIAQCRLALAKDPASRFLIESLNNALQNKVELLRTASMLPARS